jgi:tRNA nucleotidyltransferase/poly(A) polymerase
MPDYIYLLENRLSSDQQNAIRQMRAAAREAGILLFLTGDAVRDLTSGHAVHQLEVAVQGNALKLKKATEKLGAQIWGDDEASRSLYLCFPGTVRLDVISTHRVEYPKPGRPVFHPASIQEDLRRRDFTMNAMAVSLNEGSFGLLMDPFNGAADIESRTLRLVSNYGFLENPALLIRATRYLARLGWEMDPKTQARYENAKTEKVIEFLSSHARSQELEQIGHEEEPLKVLTALEIEGWTRVLFPAWTVAKADEEKLKALHDLAAELLMQGVHADMSAAQMQLLTAKLSPKELSALKKQMLRPGFVQEWNSLDSMAASFSKTLLAKENAAPSAAYTLFTTYDPEAVLWLGFTSKSASVIERYNRFLKAWPEVRQRIPHAIMQELRITPELPAYSEVVQSIFLSLIDSRLGSEEEMRAFLEPYSPPAPPPQISIKRPRAKKGVDVRLKERTFGEAEEDEDSLDENEDLEDIGGDHDDLDLGLNIPKIDMDGSLPVDAEAGDEEEVEEKVEPILEKPTARTRVHTKPQQHPHAISSAKIKVDIPSAEKAAKAEKPGITNAKPETKTGTKPILKAEVPQKRAEKSKASETPASKPGKPPQVTTKRSGPANKAIAAKKDAKQGGKVTIRTTVAKHAIPKGKSKKVASGSKAAKSSTAKKSKSKTLKKR